MLSLAKVPTTGQPRKTEKLLDNKACGSAKDKGIFKTNTAMFTPS